MRTLVIVFALTINTFSFAADRYWIAAAASNWNNTANWSLTSGGAGGASVPGAADVAIFNANGLGNCNLDMAPVLGGLTVNGYTSVIDLNGNILNVISGNTTLTTGSINDTPNSGSLSMNTSGLTRFNGSTIGAQVSCSSGRIFLDGSVFNNTAIFTKTAAGSDAGQGGNTFNSTVTLGSTAPNYFMTGNVNPDVFNGVLTVKNNGTNYIYIGHNSVGNQFNDNVLFESTGTSLGAILCQSAGASATLAATRTIGITAGGYTSGDLRLYNLTQTGATAQSFVTTGTSRIYFDNVTWNGNCNFSGSRIYTVNSTYNGTTILSKTGASDDASQGSNTFALDFTMNNSGSGYFMMGNVNPDTYSANVIINNSGSDLIYFADNSAGNTVSGNVTVTESGSATGVRISRLAGSTLTVGGNMLFNLSGNADRTDNFADAGSITITGNLIINNNSTASSVNIYLADQASSAVTVGGTSTFTNNGTGTTQRIRISESGTVNFNGDVTATNNSAATNSHIYFNRAATGVSNFNENVIIESTVAGSDGVTFGENGGSSTLAATKTITVGGAGYQSGNTYLRNFTQTGATAQNLVLTGTSYMLIYDSNWGGDVNFVSPRINTRGTTFSGISYLEKTGVTDDNSAGGNTFVGNTTLVNSSPNQFGMGNGNPDDFQSNLIVNNTGGDRFELALNSAGNIISGDFTLTNSGTSNVIVLSNNAASTLAVSGNTIINNNSSAATSTIYIGNAGTINFVGDFTYNNNASGATHNAYLSNGTSSSNTYGGTTVINNAGTGATTQRIFLGNQGDIICNGNLTLANTSGATNSEIFCNYSINSVGSYNENIVVTNTNASGGGIRFGQNTGSATLAATKTISIGAGGFVAGELYFRNFTQVGPTNHALTCTGTSIMRNIDSNWGGDVDFKAPRMITNGTFYSGTAVIEKTGGIGDDQSTGGNTFTGNVTLRNTGSEYIMMGNGSPDICQANLLLDNSGSAQMYWGYNSAGNTVAGNLTATMTGSSTGIEICNNAASDLTVTGDVNITNSTNAASNNIYLGNGGDIVINGLLNYTDNSTGASPHFYTASTTDGSLVVGGSTTIINNSTATTDSRYYIGNNGDVTFNGTLAVSNHSGANNNHIYFNLNPTSTGIYNDDIILEATHVNSDGIRFGENNGQGTLAATKTVTIGAGGFVSGDARFRNFTQVGPTPQALACTGVARIYNYDSNWGGDVVFTAPRMLTRGTTYNGTSFLEKNGASNDDSNGGNNFIGDAQLINSGSGQLNFATSVPDIWGGNLDVDNTGSHRIILASNSAGNTIAGNLTWDFTGNSNQSDVISNSGGSTMTISGTVNINNSCIGGGDLYIGNGGSVTMNQTLGITLNSSGAGNSYIYIAGGAASSVTVLGAVTAVNTASSNEGDIYFGNSGIVDFQDDFTVTNTPTGATGRILIANATSSSFEADGVSTITNNSAVSGDGRIYVGNQGDVTFNGDLTISNNSGVPTSHIYCDYGANSVGAYNENIVLNCTNASSDGIRFGEGGGSGTLAALKTVTIGVGGFIAGDLEFRNFTQIGPTNQNLTATGTARIYNYDSNWGGDIVFIAPRMLTRGTTYNLTSYLEKNGALDDASVGGNLFVGDCQLVNSGSRYFLMGNGNPDVWQANLSVLNSGSHNMYIAHASTGNTIAGTLDWIHTGSAAVSYIATSTGSDIDVIGATTISNTSTAVSSVYVANSGTATFGSTFDATNSPSSAGTGQIILAEGTPASVTIDGATTLTNNGTATTSQIVVGNNGDATFNSTLDGINAGSGTTSNFYLGNSANSTILVGGNMTFDQSGSITTTRSYLGNVSTNTYNGSLDITNSSSSNNSEIYLNRATGAIGNFNGNVTVTSEHASCDGVRFGQDGGTATLAPGQTISVGGGGFIAGDLRFRNFTQLGATIQNVTCTGTARIYHHNSVWNAISTFTAPRFYTNTTTYNDDVNIAKTGATNDDSPGGNVFNGTATVTNSGTNRLRWSNANGTPDDYNDDVTFIKTNTGIIQPSYQNTDTYFGDININTNSQIYFGEGGNGRVLLDGNTGDQDLNDLGASGIPLFRDFQVNKPVGNVNLNMPIEITVELDLDNGIVNSTATNLVYMRDNTTVSSVSDASHVDGPIEKIGNDAFVFPTGDNSLYRPIEMSNPTSGAARFRAEYFNVDPHPTYDHNSLDPTIDHISSCEYWTLDRIVSTNNVVVTLSWDTPTSCGVSTLPDLIVARWDGAVWKDHGNGGTTGNATAGTVSSSAAITNFSPFTLASITPFNPLPIELIAFNATLNKNVVDLDWTTASEVDNDYFIVERSFDGENFEYLVELDGAGTSTAIQEYKTIDENPNAGINYYRLKQVDFNGDFEYSETRSIDVPRENLNEIEVYPNPTTGQLSIVLENISSSEIQLINALGQIIPVLISIEDNLATIDLSAFEDGVYFIRTESTSTRIIKQ